MTGKMSPFKTVLVLVLIKVFSADALVSTSFPIGGIINNETLRNTQTVFENIGFGDQNSLRAYYGRMLDTGTKDIYSTSLRVCENTSGNSGVVAVIDSRDTDGICDNTCLLCNRLNISYLTIGWQPITTQRSDLFTIAYYPSPELISKAYAALITKLQWDKLTILYEDDNSFIRLQEVINTWPHDREPIMYRQLDPTRSNRETFKHIFKVARMSYHILDCDIDNIVQYMQEITEVENATEYQSFILTPLDAHNVNMGLVSNFRANVSTMHFVNRKDPRWKDIGVGSRGGVRMETALAADALYHLEKAIRKMQDDRELQEEEGEARRPSRTDYGVLPQICYKETKAEYEDIAWASGYDLREAILTTQTKGFTGDIEFDKYGQRTNFKLYYSKLSNTSEFDYAGHWQSTTNIIEDDQVVPDRSTSQMSGIVKVVSRRGLPYFDVADNENKTKRGYAVDLVNKIFEFINKDLGTEFVPEFHEVYDKNYGNPIEGTKKWNGLIGELLTHTADLAICDLSITSERNAVVDFSTPFMTTGIAILFKKEDPDIPDMFSFLNPLSLDVWLYLATTYIIVSFVLLICARMSQDDWVNPHPCNQNPEHLENIWSLYNCLWLTMGTIMTQGCDILPRGFGSRWITGMWWFFAMIITASYTANMSTFLSNDRRSNDIKDVKDLAEQTSVSYGAVYNASTYNFFKDSNDSMYQKMWSVMQSTKPTVFTYTNMEGMDRVNRSSRKFAFFMESAAIQYFTERYCQLKMVGNELDSKEYGIAMPKNSPHKANVDRAILKLQEAGILSVLKHQWWTLEDNTARCSDVKKGQAEPDMGLQMKNTSGIFLVLGMGGVLGFIVAIIDFLLHAREVSVKEKVTFKEALQSEWNASLNPRALSKPVAPTRSAPPSRATSPLLQNRSQSRAVSVLRAATSFINFDEIY